MDRKEAGGNLKRLLDAGIEKQHKHIVFSIVLKKEVQTLSVVLFSNVGAFVPSLSV
jgi:hypothetical protein